MTSKFLLLDYYYAFLVNIVWYAVMHIHNHKCMCLLNIFLLIFYFMIGMKKMPIPPNNSIGHLVSFCVTLCVRGRQKVYIFKYFQEKRQLISFI